MTCWNGLCIAGDCDEDSTQHVDATGQAWTQAPGSGEAILIGEPNHGLDPMLYPAD